MRVDSVRAERDEGAYGEGRGFGLAAALWGSLFIGLMLFNVRGTARIEESPLSAGNAHRVVVPILVGVISLAGLTLKKRLIPSRGPLRWFLCYAVLCIISAAWSGLPMYTAFRGTEYLIAVVATWFVVVNERRSESILIVALWGYGALCLSAVLGAVIKPSEALSVQGVGLLPFRLAGVFPVLGPSHLGHFGAVFFCFALSCLIAPPGRLRFGALRLVGLWILLAVGLLLPIVTQSRTAQIQIVVGAILAMILVGAYRLLAVTAAGMLVLATSVGNVILAFFSRGKSFEALQTFSGRVNFWETAIPYIRARPIAGYGHAYGTRFVVFGAIPGEEDTSHLHNSLLDVLVNNGVVGMILLLCGLVGVGRVLFKYWWSGRQDTWVLFCILMVAVIILRVITTSVLVYHDYYTLFFLAVVGFTHRESGRAVSSRDVVGRYGRTGERWRGLSKSSVE